MFYEQFVTFEHKSGDTQIYAKCPLHVEDTASFTVNTETGEWYCHGCGKGGAEKEFIHYYYDVPLDIAKKAFMQWEKKGTLPFPSEEQIEAYHKKLLEKPREVEYLQSAGISREVIDEFKLGIDDCRITIPIKSRTGQYVNIRKYLPPHRRLEGSNNAKCINLRGLGSKRYFPYEAFEQDTIYVVEGEKDCLAARSQGLNAVTGTGGSAIPTEELMLFKAKNVYLMLDTDTVGKRNVKNYINMLRTIAKSIHVVELPTKDYSDYYVEYGAAPIESYIKSVEEVQSAEDNVEAPDLSLVKSEFTEHLNTWVKLHKMSVVGAEPKVYTIPTRLKAVCRNAKCSKPCPLACAGVDESVQIVDVDPRQILQFVDAADSAQDSYLRKMFGCKSVAAEPVEYINVQKIIFQESASFIDGIEEASFESRYGIYMYTDYRLSATLKYDFEACRVTDPRTQQNYYVIKSAEAVGTSNPGITEGAVEYFRSIASKHDSALGLLQEYYEEWMPTLAIEGRLDLFGAVMLTYCSVTEIPWQNDYLKGWLDILCIGDTRTGKSQLAQRFVKHLGMGSYINGENARRTGVIGGVQRFGDSWVVTWGAIPMNDRGLLIIDEASGLEIDDIKDLSSTRSSGAVTLNKIVKGEARARTRLLWLSNPRSGKNLVDYYWKGYGAFQEFIPVVEDQARYDLVITAAREDVDVLNGVESDKTPDMELWRSLITTAWTLPGDRIRITADVRSAIKAAAHSLNGDYSGGPLIVGVAVHEKILRLSCAFAVLCGDIYEGTLEVSTKHVAYAEEFIRFTLDKASFGYRDYMREFRRAQTKRQDNISYIRGIIALHPALKVLLSSSGFKGYQFQEILGIDRSESSKIMSDLITRGLLRPSSGATYVPDKLLMEIAKQMED